MSVSGPVVERALARIDESDLRRLAELAREDRGSSLGNTHDGAVFILIDGSVSPFAREPLCTTWTAQMA